MERDTQDHDFIEISIPHETEKILYYSPGLIATILTAVAVLTFTNTYKDPDVIIAILLIMALFFSILFFTDRYICPFPEGTQYVYRIYPDEKSLVSYSKLNHPDVALDINMELLRKWYVSKTVDLVYINTRYRKKLKAQCLDEKGIRKTIRYSALPFEKCQWEWKHLFDEIKKYLPEDVKIWEKESLPGENVQNPELPAHHGVVESKDMSEERPMFSINIYTPDRYLVSVAFFIIFSFIFTFASLCTLLFLLFGVGDRVEHLLWKILISSYIGGISCSVLPVRNDYLYMNIYSNRLQEERTLFKIPKNENKLRRDIPFQYLRIYPVRTIFLSKAYAFRDIRFNRKRKLAPHHSMQIMSHIKLFVSEKQWQEINRMPWKNLDQ